MRMQAVHEVSRGINLNKALRYCGMSKRAWYYVKKPRDVAIDANVTDRVRGIASKRPTYGTRRMAAQVARETGVPTNRKKIQRIYRKIGELYSSVDTATRAVLHGWPHKLLILYRLVACIGTLQRNRDCAQRGKTHTRYA